MCFGRSPSAIAPAPIPTPMPAPMKAVTKVKNPALAKRKKNRRGGGMKSLAITRPTNPKGGFAGAGSNTKTYNA